MDPRLLPCRVQDLCTAAEDLVGKRTIVISRGTIHLLIGPVGAGKSTYARQKVAHSPAVFLNLDSWMKRLFGADERPTEGLMAWYQERRDRCRALMWDTALNVLACGTDVFLEIGLLGALEREAFYDGVHTEGIELKVYFVDAPRDTRRERVVQRNNSPQPDTQVVPLAVFEYASDLWEPPSEAERTRWNIIDV